MVRIHTIDIVPPIANASCAWASDYEQLRELYECPHTGAVTTRTATLTGFAEDGKHTVWGSGCLASEAANSLDASIGRVHFSNQFNTQLIRLLAAPSEVVP